MRRGTPNAKYRIVSTDDKLISLVKEYAAPDFKTKPTDRDLRHAERLQVEDLHREIRRLNDRIRRYREQIEDEIKMLSAVLDEDKKESVEALRRRISRLKGALEYRGRDDYTLTER